MNTTGTLTFLARRSAAPVYRASVGGGDTSLDLAGEFEDHTVDIVDGRMLTDPCRLERHGFEHREHASRATDLYDAEVRANIYDPECAELVRQATGAREVIVFDHTPRSSDPAIRSSRLSREPASVVHNDYTPRSAPQRVRDLVPERAEELLARPFAIINVWRPLRRVEAFPIAFCDAQTLSESDLVAAERRAQDRIGEIFMLQHSGDQRWMYFPDMTPAEVILIKTYDSRRDGRARWAAHTAFDAADRSPSAAPRESLETRTFAFF